MSKGKKTVYAGSAIGVNGAMQFELMPNGRSARLINEFVVKISEKITIRIPAGFVTDFASVPRFFWRIVPPWGRYSPAAVVHDYLYASGMVKRAEADRIFLRLMKKLGVPYWKRHVMYLGVRAGGRKAWNEHRNKDRKNR